MHGRDGQVDDDLHVRMGQRQLGRTTLGDAVRRRLPLREFRYEVGDDPDVEIREAGEIVQVLSADPARADQRDPNGARHDAVLGCK
ncbi:hypothetical protein GCM10012284_14640 [Mangrovihabitans endophyticus]|uniref:Uncharacterized protein n=1 Tax=Mangrovihabitans endophyticus TaxID=1751298 RepID=A0A8J3FMB1_9ACTN|nr:hypothetical protein GCM10012284_14640 [Mangrovihabitans endophyticus]